MTGGSKDILCNCPKPLFRTKAMHDTIANDFFILMQMKLIIIRRKKAFAFSLILKVRVFNIS